MPGELPDGRQRVGMGRNVPLQCRLCHVECDIIERYLEVKACGRAVNEAGSAHLCQGSQIDVAVVVAVVA